MVPKSNGRIDSLTGIRAYAVLWVALFHFSTNAGVKGVLDIGAVAEPGPFGVDVLFVLSGLILSHTYARAEAPGLDLATYKSIVVRRFARLYPLHLVTFLLAVVCWSVAIKAGYAFRYPDARSGYTAVLNVLFVQGWGFTDRLAWNVPSWSASAAWFASLFILPWCLVVGRRLSSWVVLAIVVASWLALIFFVETSALSGVILHSAGICRIFPEFLAGFLIYRVAHRVSVGNDFLALAGFASIICAVATHAFVLMLPAISLLLLGIYRGGGPMVRAACANPVALFLGKISYSIFMVHWFVKIASDQVVRHAGISVGGWAILIADFAATVLVAYGAFVLVERPARRWIVDRYERRAESTGAIVARAA
jgi:peptidoglycan/LPS O-acetylase OafA/YrhL